MAPAALRDYQRESLDEIQALWAAGHGRVTVQLPCGTGKTVVAVHAIQVASDVRRVVFFVPTLVLLAKTIEELATNLPDFKLVGVCSKDAFSAEAHLPEQADTGTVEDVAATGVPVTTDPDVLAEHLVTGQPVAVVSTYASAQVIATVDASWDLLICDEAHHTAGSSDKAWSLPLYDEWISARLRLFLTATPRQIDLDPNNVDEAGEPLPVASMTDPALYGSTLTGLTFRDAIDKGWLSDYRIAVVVVSEKDVERHIHMTLDDDGYPIEIDKAAAQVALLRAARKHRINSALVFSNTIDASIKWERQFRRIAEKVENVRSPDDRIEPSCAHIDGTSTTRWRELNLRRLRDAGENKLVVVSNVRVFSEGIDLPALDAVVLAEPRTSGPDIVQIVGRAIRPHPDGADRAAVIVLPVLIRDRDRPVVTEQVVARTGWLAAWQVLTTLAHEDSLLFSGLASARTAAERDLDEPVDVEEHTSGRVSVDLALTSEDLGKAFQLRLLRRTTSSWVLLAEYMRDFVAEHGHTHPRRGYELRHGYPLGRRAYEIRRAYTQNRLTPEIARLFDNIPHWDWSPRRRKAVRSFDEWLGIVRTHLEKTGANTILPFEKTPTKDGMATVGKWVATQARNWGRLDSEKQAALTKTLGEEWLHRK